MISIASSLATVFFRTFKFYKLFINTNLVMLLPQEIMDNYALSRFFTTQPLFSTMHSLLLIVNFLFSLI